jgi:maltose alpha-D-glucosyltransferase/alpha-amylase
MGDDIWLDDRNGVRTPMQWDSSSSAGFSDSVPEGFYASVIDSPLYGPKSVNVAAQQADPKSLFHTIRGMISVRKRHKAFGWGSFQSIDTGKNAVAAYLREYQGDRILVLNNLSDQSQNISIPYEAELIENILTGEKLTSIPQNLKPYQYLWLKL